MDKTPSATSEMKEKKQTRLEICFLLGMTKWRDRLLHSISPFRKPVSWTPGAHFEPLLIELLLPHQSIHRLLIMPKDQSRSEKTLQLQNHVMAPNPSRLISLQPALGMRHVVVLCNVILIRSPYESPILFQIDLHDAQPWSMAWRVMECNALAEVEASTGEDLPLQLGQIHIVS